jgi:hypothetical protein
VNDLEEVRKRLIRLIGQTNLIDSDTKQSILKAMGSPALMREQTIMHVRYGMVLAVDVLEEYMREKRELK